MTAEDVTLQKVAKFLDVSAGELTFNDEEKIVRTHEGQVTTGFATIVCQYIKEAEKFDWGGSADDCLVYQWFEFVSIFGPQLSTTCPKGREILKNLDKYIESISYLVGFGQTLADVVVYYALYDYVTEFTPADCQAFANLCRWFDHIQFDPNVRQNNLVNFHINYNLARATLAN